MYISVCCVLQLVLSHMYGITITLLPSVGTKKGPGERGGGRPTSCQSSTYALDRQTWEGCQTLSTQPWVGIQASDPLFGGGQGAAQPGSPGVTF